MDGGEQPREREPFPPPPPWFHLFGKEAAARRAPPAPPPPPADGKFKMFGVEYDMNEPPLQKLDCEQLFDDSEGSDLRPPLKRMNRELLFIFFDYIGLLAGGATMPEEGPPPYEGHMQSLNLLFSNVNHLLNTLRKQQLRDTVEATLRDSIATRRKLVGELRQARAAAAERVAQVLADCKAMDPPVDLEALSLEMDPAERELTEAVARLSAEKRERRAKACGQ